MEQMVLEQPEISLGRNTKLDHDLTSYRKMNGRWNTDLKAKTRALESVEQNTFNHRISRVPSTRTHTKKDT